MNSTGAERRQRVDLAIGVLQQEDERRFAAAQLELMTGIDSLNFGVTLPMVQSPERMEYALKGLRVRNAAYLPLVTNLKTQEAYAIIVGIMFVDIACSDYMGIEGLRPLPGTSELLPIELCARDWIKKSYERVAMGVPPALTRRGYRLEVHGWMKRAGVESQKNAARRLGVSIDVLKSIMSDKGRARYSQDTLKDVLGKIGHQEDEQDL